MFRWSWSFLVVVACSFRSTAEPTQADLRRAAQLRPSREYLGKSPQHLSEVLNRHLRKLGQTAACDSISISELSDMQQLLLGLRHDALDAVYRNANDRRMLILPNFEEETMLLSRRPDLSQVVREAKCRQVVMWFVHHLSEGARAEALRLPGFALPLLPPSSANDLGIDGIDADENSALALYEKASMCLPCHVDGTEPPTPSPPPADPDHTGPDNVAWPDNVDYTLYAGLTGCCSASNNYTEIRHIKRRYTHRQQLDVNYYVDCSTSMKPSFVNECKGGGFGPEDRTCMLDECKAGTKTEWTQYAQCHIFYNGSDIWEWYPEDQRCTKLISGAGMPGPWGLTDSTHDGTFAYQGIESMYDAPDVTQNRSCHKWCSPNPPFAPEGTCFWQFEDGAPCKHQFPDGVDFYGSAANGDWRVVDDDGPIFTELPEYCPPQESKALLGPQFPNQDLVCSKWWYDQTDSQAMV